MGDKAIVFLIVSITITIMSIFGYRGFTRGTFCSKCKINKKKK